MAPYFLVTHGVAKNKALGLDPQHYAKRGMNALTRVIDGAYQLAL